MIDLVSLFSGAGALDLGLQSCSRFRTRLRVDYQGEFCETLVANQERGFLESAELRVSAPNKNQRWLDVGGALHHD